MLAALALHRSRQEQKKYPYNASERFGAQYRDGRWLHFASNLPKSVVESLNASEPSSTKNVEKVKIDDLVKESKKFEEKLKLRKTLRPPSVKEVRNHLRHMVNFSTSHYEAEFKSVYPLLAPGGKILEEDSESEDDEKSKRGTVDKVKNAKKIHDALIRNNPDIPMHRK